MKQFYFFILFLVSNLIFSQNFTDTKGELQISSSGAATYNLPIALPPSIKNVAPIINLTYSSGVRGGIAGQGWSISSISSISRISTRRDIDGFVDGVDFDGDDKLAIDGQRLILKSGTYWGSGSIYETEYKSNTKIEYFVEAGKSFFIVTAPDGSRSWYGSTGNGTYEDIVSATGWHIIRYEDVNGNRIEYTYNMVFYGGTNQFYIKKILFSGNPTVGIAYQNSIDFEYKYAERVERDFINGSEYYASQILDSIEVRTNNAVFRKYQLIRKEDALGYERVSKIQEFNAQGEPSNPVEFDYDSTGQSLTRSEKSYTNNLEFDKTDLAGDFDGDGRLDFVSDNKVFTNLFENSTGHTPTTLPFVADKRQLFTAHTLSDNRLNQFQTIVFADETASQINFKNYNYSETIFPASTKTININNSYSSYQSNLDTQTYNYDCIDELLIQDEIQNCTTPTKRQSNEYLEGDFNGDGISEVLICSKINERYYYATTTDYSSIPNYEQVYYEEGDYWALAPVYHFKRSCEIKAVDDGEEFYWLNLDVNASTTLGSSGHVKFPDSSLLAGDKKIIADFNSDGKSDILVINHNGDYKVVSFKQLTAAPWVELEVIGTGTIDKYSPTKQLLLGDYNGDGKTDIMLPDSEGGLGHTLWHTYYGNPKPTGVVVFKKESQDIVEYWPNTGSYYDTQTHFSTYYALDINGDGKSDVVRVWRKYYKKDWTINNHNTQWQVTAYTNNIGKVDNSSYILTDASGVYDSGFPEIPIPVVSNYKYQGANTDLVLVRGHHNLIEYYRFDKDFDTDNRLKSVTESNGNIKQTIEYSAMHPCNGLCNGLGSTSTDFYSSANAALYPNIEIIRNSNTFLVSKLTATINGVSKYQDFRYFGYVSNFNYGTVGFTRTTRSSWYLSASDTKIWTTQHNDVNLRGANILTWTNTSGTTVFDAVPSNLLSTKTNVFNTYVNPVSKVYNVLLNSQTTLDALTSVKSETTYTYDGTVNSSNYYGLQTQSLSKQYSGASLQGTTTTTTTYDNNPTGTGSAYYIGRPKSTNTSTNIYMGDTRNSGETYTYTGNNLTKTEKTGHNTTFAIVEDMAYDTVGNLLTKTVSAPSAVPAPVARTIRDEYDSTKRFVVKKTDHQGFVTAYAYNTLGQVKQSTDYLGVISDYVYDNWGKLTNTTVTNSSMQPLTTALAYTKLSSGGYTVTSTTNRGEKTVTEYDVLGRTIKNSVNGFAANTMVTKQIVYDGLGRKTKESEPYFSTPNLWTNYEYDYLVRPTKITTPTGKIQTFSYSVLTTTSNDDGKITTATVDALGNKVQTTDPGGTINFIYFANGKLKESGYQGNKVIVDIDGWGNKVSMTDPSAGTYTYSYDAFGQLKTETTPNGTTSFTYDNAGRQTEKTIVGTNTDSKTTYVYNSVNQITGTTFLDNIAVKTTTNTYEYDNLKRLFKTSETSPYAVFVKQLTFDSVGRIDTETSTATAAGKTSSKAIKKTYQNGFPWQILDNGNQQVLWQTNSLNERGQLLTAAFANGIAITNTYDQFGYNTQIKHDKTNPVVANVMTLNTVFDAKTGNLSSRYSSLFDRNEVFEYDNLERLIKWDKAPVTIANEPFLNGLGNFWGDSSLTNESQRLKVTTNPQPYSGARRLLVPNAKVNEKFSVSLYLDKGTSAYTRIIIGERDPATDQWAWSLKALATSGTYSFDHTVSQYSEIYLIFDKGDSSTGTDYTKTTTYYVDNLSVKYFPIEKQQYDDKGRINQNELGSYQYDQSKVYQNSAVTTDDSTNAYYKNREGIFYDGMEEYKVWGDIGMGWNLPIPVYENTPNGTNKPAGKLSLKINNGTSSETFIHMDKWIPIDNKVDTQYTYSGWVYSDNPSAEILLFMNKSDETGYFTAADSKITYTKNQWVYLEKTVTVPANIKKLNLRLDNNGLGNVWFDDLKIRKTSDPTPAERKLNVSYNVFKAPFKIEETGVDKIDFTYNTDNSRSSMFYGGLQDDPLARPMQKHYSADGTMEIKQNKATGSIEFVTYIGGDGYTAPIVFKNTFNSDNSNIQDYLYLHRDYQGTIVAITDQSGNINEKRHFDPWGNIVDVQDGNNRPLYGLTILDRGYTGHEHLQSVGLINMNARLYDPKLHRFLQPDNFVQDQFNTQNYNRYGYCLNNPLKYTDPSGEIIPFAAAVIIGAIVSAATYTMTALLADVPFSVGGLAQATFIGAASAAVTFGIGSAANSMCTSWVSSGWQQVARGGFQAVAHGTFQGGMTAISGGKFWSGFAAGAVSSIASSLWYADFNGGKGGLGALGGVRDNTLGMIAFGTVAGGGGAAMTGGNFWQGAATGLVVSGLNHAMHQMDSEDGNPPRKTAKAENTKQGSDGEIKVVFNGRTVKVIDSEGNALFEHSATSGKGKYMNNSKYQNVQNEGPIPEGIYSFDVSDWNSQSSIRQLYNVMRGNGDWGDYNVSLTPLTYKGSRHSFYLHGGSYPGSAGCIDANAGISQIRNLSLSQTNVRVIVKYGK